MAIYRNANELQGKVLEEGDIVIFEVDGHRTKYTVWTQFLDGGGDNKRIFDLLGMGGSDKYNFASNCYGYSSVRGAWPEYETNDYEAATRMVLALFEKIAPPPKIIDDDGNIW